mmetsp:Transcript_44950/g.141504  ORF Transcript_44950/g.141504 Transcript_44950/m.141504 type:complete len:265 (-) Transcript_44950:223-1017(-)
MFQPVKLVGIGVLPCHLCPSPSKMQSRKQLLRQPAVSGALCRSVAQEILLSIGICRVDRPRAIAVPVHVVQWAVPCRALIADDMILLVRVRVTQKLVIRVLRPVLLHPIVPWAEPMEKFTVVVLRTEAIVLTKVFAVAVGIDFTVVMVVDWKVIAVVLVVTPGIVDILSSVGSSLHPIEEPFPVETIVVCGERAIPLGIVDIITDVLLLSCSRIDPVAIIIVAFDPVLSSMLAISQIIVYVMIAVPVSRHESELVKPALSHGVG